MSYLTVISVADAKNRLGIDDTFHDSTIESMIKSSLSSIENQTCKYFYARNKEYTLNKGSVKVYDFPINSVVSPDSEDDYKVTKKTLHSIYTVSDSDTETITLNIGYTSVDNIPVELIEVAHEMIFKSFNRLNDPLSMISKTAINQNKRFV